MKIIVLYEFSVLLLIGLQMGKNTFELLVIIGIIREREKFSFN